MVRGVYVLFLNNFDYLGTNNYYLAVIYKNVSPTFRLENVRPVIRFPLVRFFAMGAPRANVLLLGMFSLFGFRDFRGIDLPKLMRVKPAACGSSAGGGGVTPAPRPAPLTVSTGMDALPAGFAVSAWLAIARPWLRRRRSAEDDEALEHRGAGFGMPNAPTLAAVLAGRTVSPSGALKAPPVLSRRGSA